MTSQLNLTFAETLRDQGIAKALHSAERECPNWTENAYSFLLNYIKSNKEFMAEDVREASKGIVSDPPSQRAWGGVFVRAVKSGLITRKGFRNTRNAKAHCTPASVWERV